MKKYKYCGDNEGFNNMEEFVESLINPEDVFIDVLGEEEECCNGSARPTSCVSCYRNENLKYCGEDYPQLGIYKGDHYDDVIDAIVNNLVNGKVIVQNSDGSYSVVITAPDTLILPNITFTTDDGYSFTHPSVVDIVNDAVVIKKLINIILNGVVVDQIENTQDEIDITPYLPSCELNVSNSNGSYDVNITSDLILPDTDVEIEIENTNGDSISTTPYSLFSAVDNGQKTIQIPDTDVQITVKDQNGNTLSVTNYSLDSSVNNGNKDISISIPDGEVEVYNSNNDIVDTVQVPYGQTVLANAPDASYTLQDTNNITIISGSIPSNETVNITAPDATYTLQNTDSTILSTGNIVSNGSSTIIAPDATANLEDEDGNPISSTTIPSGSADTLVAPNGTVIVEYADGTPIQTVNVPSGGSNTVVVPNCQDSTVDIEDTDGNPLYSLNIPSGSSSNQIINDSIAILKDTDGNIISTTNILAESTEDIIAPDGTVNIEYADGTPIDTANVMSGETTTVTIPNPPIEWVLQFFNQNDVIQVVVDAGNITTFTSGFGVDVGSIEVSNDGITYTPISFPFTPAVGTWYFKRSSNTITGSYTISE